MKILLPLSLIPALFFTQCTVQSNNRSQEVASYAVDTQYQWPNYGRDPGGARFAPWTIINRENVSQLKPAWTFRTGELETYQGTEVIQKSAFEATPIISDSILYFSTPTNRVFAVHAATGKELWSYDSKIDLNAGYSEITSRGVSLWINNSKKNSQPGFKNVIVATIDGRIISLDAYSGKPNEEFGTKGQVDMKEGVGRIQFTSPPAIIDNMIIIGSTMGDNQRVGYPRGVVRALHAETGRLIWSWDPIPSDPEDEAFATWEGARDAPPGAANAWAPLSVDVTRDMVFIPTSCPSPDYFGGKRIGTNLYANSLVALRASTGERLWHFQTVHHDIWDYDIPAQPLLVDLEANGNSVAAAVIVTKMGHIFAFERESGNPIFPIEERAVPASTVDGEVTHPTQPFPSQLPMLGLRTIDSSQAWGPTPELLEKSKQLIAKYDNRGMFTPPSLSGSIITPGNAGGMNWSGASFHPEEQILITNVSNLPALITLFPRSSNSVGTVNEAFPRAEIGRQEGTPYIMTRDYLMDFTSDGELYLQVKPPWGTLAAIDMRLGTLKWEVPLGIMLNPQKYPGAEKWGSFNMGGSITTAGGLVFIAAALDNIFRAFDIHTGEILWQAELPAAGHATPMSYVYDGKQYIVICAGGHGKIGTKMGDHVVAFSLE